MTPAPLTAEALVDGADDMPTDAEIEAMRQEAENFRLPTPPPIPIRERFYLTECEHCGWIGSSEQCGGDAFPGDDDIICAVCCSSIRGDSPSEADTAKHGEAVYQRILAAEASLQRVTAERDEAREKIEAARGVAAGWPVLEGQETLAGKIMTLAAAARQATLSERGTQFVLQHLMRALDAADTATAEAARLRGEVEAKDRALKIAVDALTWLRAPFRGSSEATRLQMREDAQEALDEIARIALSEKVQADA